MFSGHRGRTLNSTTSRKTYALTATADKSVLSRDELRSIDRFVDTATVTGASAAGAGAPSSHIRALPFEELPAGGDAQLGMAVSPINARESAIDVPLRFTAPDTLHAPPLEDPPSAVPLARRVVALLKGAESAPMTWTRQPAESHPSRATAEISALKDAETRAQAAARGGNKSQTARLYTLLGSLHYNYGNISLAVDAFTKALDAFIAVPDTRGTAYCHNVLGVCHFRLQEYKMALLHHKKQEVLGGCYGQCVAQINMGVSYAALGELEFAEQAFEDALANAKGCDDGMLETVAEGNLGLTTLRLGNMRAAQEHLEQCLELCSVAGDKSGASICLLLLGELYSVIHDHQHAIFYYEHAFRVAGEAGNPETVDIARVSVGVARGNAVIREAVLRQAILMGKKNDVHSIVKLLPS